MASFFDDECAASGDDDDDEDDDASVGSAGSLRDFIVSTDDENEDEEEDEEEVTSRRDQKKRRRCKEESNSAAGAPSRAVARVGEDGAAFERRRKKIVADRERRARNKVAVTAGDVGALEKKGKKNKADRQRCRDLKTAQGFKNGGRALATRERFQRTRKDRKRKAVQRTLSNTDSFHIADIFQRYRQGEDLTAPDRADYEGSDEPLEWKWLSLIRNIWPGEPWPKTSSFSPAFHQPRLRRQRCALIYIMFAMVSRSWQRLLLLTTSTTCVCTKRQVVLFHIPTPFLPVPLTHNISQTKKKRRPRAHHKPGRI